MAKHVWEMKNMRGSEKFQEMLEIAWEERPELSQKDREGLATYMLERRRQGGKGGYVRGGDYSYPDAHHIAKSASMETIQKYSRRIS